MCMVRRFFFNAPAGEQFFGMTAFAVISGEHIRRHGLSETAGAADAEIFYTGFIQFLVDEGNHARFVNVNIIGYCLAKGFISWIEIQSHEIHLFFPVFQTVSVLMQSYHKKTACGKMNKKLYLASLADSAV